MIADVIGQLRATEQQLAKQLESVRAAINALDGGSVVKRDRLAAPTTPVRKRRRLSAKARAAISHAQKLRWAKQRAGKN